MDDLFGLHPHGLFLRREALRLGYDDRDISRALRAGQISRIRQGSYMPGPRWHEAEAEERHLLRAQAVMLRHEDRVALSHTTGALLYGLRTWDPDLTQVHVTRLEATTARRESDVAYHRGGWSPDDVWAMDEMLLLDPTRCALQTASLTSVEAGLVVLDSLLDHDLGNEEGLAQAFKAMNRGPFSRRLHVSLRLARRGSQSVGETRTRFLFWLHHLPEPQLQYPVYDGSTLVGITDFAWPAYGLLGEFDGKVKYGRYLKPGETPGDAVFREKRREDKLVEVTGMRMIRYTYGDLYIPADTAARTRRMLSRARTA